MLVTALAGTGFQFSWDGSDDGYIDSGPIAGSEPIYPSLLRLEKRGTTFRAYVSTDDSATWTQIGEAVDVPSADVVQDVGMFVTALNSEPSLATFDNFSIESQ